MTMDASNKRSLFRFQDLEIWKKAVEIANKLFDLADELEKKRLYRFAEQVRGAGLSISNNIAEGRWATSVPTAALVRFHGLRPRFRSVVIH